MIFKSLQLRSAPSSTKCGKLYGRQEEVRQIREAIGGAAYDATRNMDPTKQIVLVDGISGVGKTSLIQEALATTSTGGKKFLLGRGKLLQSKTQHNPHAALSHCLSQIVGQILHDPHLSEVLRVNLENGLSRSQIKGIAQLVPEILQLIPLPLDGSSHHGTRRNSKLIPLSLDVSSHHRRRRNGVTAGDAAKLQSAFRQLVEIIAAPQNVVLIIVLDDLQWINPSTMDVLQALASSSELKHFVILGSLRDSEVHGDHAMRRWMDKPLQENATITQIHLSNFSLDQKLLERS